MKPFGLLLAVAAMLGAGSTGRAAVAPTRCHTGDLAGVIRRGEPGAGQRYATLVLRNRSTRTCTLRGYVGMLLLDRRGHALPTRVVRDRSRRTHRVLLGPGAHASALLHWTAVSGPPEPPRGPCEPSPRRVEVTPPDETLHLLLRWRGGPVCQRGRIQTLPLRAGSRGF